MDLIVITREKIERAGNGDHIAGLRAVLLHVETAVAHLVRGQDTSDDSAFTDAIYRTNQAFEGSLKEAYRVLADKNPDKKTPHQIEKYLTENDIFRDRVLSQLTVYRKEWRNPSTHDHKLDFDASEAFLAIVSVCAFTNLLLDQILGKISRDKSVAAATNEKQRLEKTLAENDADLAMLVANIAYEFFSTYETKQTGPRMQEAELLSALSGFTESLVPDLSVQIDTRLSDSGLARADLLVSRDDNQLLVELKRMRYSKRLVRDALDQLDHYVGLTNITQCLLILPTQSPVILDSFTPHGNRVVIVGPEKTAT